MVSNVESIYTHSADFVIVYGFVSRKFNITAVRARVIEYNGNNELRKQIND